SSSAASSGRSTLAANSSPVSLAVARRTSPMAPRPITSCRRYRWPRGTPPSIIVDDIIGSAANADRRDHGRMGIAAPPARVTASELGTPKQTASRRFDGLVAVLSAVFIGGLYLDGWAHVHGHVDQSFFTP